jgi:hypothetical protein
MIANKPTSHLKTAVILTNFPSFFGKNFQIFDITKLKRKTQLCFYKTISSNFIAKISSLEISKKKKKKKHTYAGRGKRRKEGEMWHLEELTTFSTSRSGNL